MLLVPDPPLKWSRSAPPVSMSFPPAGEAVVAGVATDIVVAVAASETVVPVAADERVIASIADEGVVARAAGEVVVAVAAAQGIVARPAVDSVIASAAGDAVIAIAGLNIGRHVDRAADADAVIPRRTNDVDLAHFQPRERLPASTEAWTVILSVWEFSVTAAFSRASAEPSMVRTPSAKVTLDMSCRPSSVSRTACSMAARARFPRAPPCRRR